MKNKKKKYLTKIFIFIILILIVLGGSGYAIYKILFDDDKPVKITKVAKEIKNWDYTLDDRDTMIMEEEFKYLNEILSKSSINYEEYAKTLCRLFVIDLYTLNNKINSYDVGGIEYVLDSSVDNYKTNVSTTIYKYIEDNTKGDRKQELPIVDNVEIESIVAEKITVDKEEYDGYSVKIIWTYKKDLGYDSYANIKLIKQDKKLWIVSKEELEKKEIKNDVSSD